MKNIITGKTGNGMFVYVGPAESYPDLAHRWLNYGFNDYVSERYNLSHYDYIRYEVSSKADDKRGRWVKAWMTYGHLLAILYFEVFHPTQELRYNAFRKDTEFLDLLNIDYTRLPPGFDPDLDNRDYFDLTYHYSVVRVLMDDKKRYQTVSIRTPDGQGEDFLTVLANMGYPENYEIETIHFWKPDLKSRKGAEQ